MLNYGEKWWPQGEVREGPSVKPRLAFMFPLNENRRLALVMIKEKSSNIENVLNLVKSNDFVEQLAGLYFLGKDNRFFGQLEVWNEQVCLEVSNRMLIGNNLRARIMAAKALVNVGPNSLPILGKAKSLCDVSYPDAHWDDDGIALLRQEIELAELKIKARVNGKNMIPVLEDMCKEDSNNIFIALNVLAEYGAEAEDVIRRIARNVGRYSESVRFYILLELGKFDPEEAKSLLKDVAFSESDTINYWPRWRAAQAFVDLLIKEKSDTTFEVLKQMVESGDNVLEEAAVRGLVIFGNRALTIIRRTVDSYKISGQVRDAASEAEIEIIIGTTPPDQINAVLGSMVNDEKGSVGKLASKKLEELNANFWLLATQKPMLASAYPGEVFSRMEKLGNFSNLVKQKFGDALIGFVIFGSTHRGTVTSKSDYDWGLIAKNLPGIAGAFQEFGWDNDIILCTTEHYVMIDEKENPSVGEPEVLFEGLFWGDHRKLARLQYNLVSNISADRWDGIRSRIFTNEICLPRVQERFNLSDESTEELSIASILSRVPPDHKEMLQILRRRLKNEG